MSTHSDSFPHPLTSQVRPAAPLRAKLRGRRPPRLHRPAWTTRDFWTKTKVSRAAAIALLVLFGAWLFYLVAANVVLKTHALRSLANKNPAKLEIDYTDAWTAYPGQFHVDNLKLRSSDDSIEWVLRVDDAEAHFAFWPILKKRFELTKIRARGMSLRLRHKVDPSDVTPRYLAALVPVDGFADPPLKPTVKKPPPSDEDYDLVTIQLEDTDVVGVREIWIDEYRYTGDLHAFGRFFLKPLRKVDVGPAHADVHAGEVHLGKDVVATDLHGTLDVTIFPFDPRDTKGPYFFEHMTASTDLDGRLDDLRFVTYYFKHGTPPEIEGGRGPVHSHVVIEHGVLAPDSEVTVTANDLVVGSGEWHAAVAARVVAQVKQPPGAERAAIVTAQLPGALARKGWEKAPLRAKSATLFVRVKDVDLTHRFDDATIGVELPDVEVPDVRVLSSYIAKPNLEVMAGAGRVTAHALLDAKSKTGKGELAVSLRGVDLRYQDKHLVTDLYADTRMKHVDLRAGTIDLTGSSLQLSETGTPAHDAPHAWWGRADIEKGSLTLEDPTFDAELTTRGRDGRPLVSFFPQDYPNWVTGLFALDGLSGRTHFHATKDGFALGPFDARGGDFEVEGRFEKKKEHKKGAFLVRYNLLTLGIDVEDQGTKLVPLGATTWYRQQAR